MRLNRFSRTSVVAFALLSCIVLWSTTSLASAQVAAAGDEKPALAPGLVAEYFRETPDIDKLDQAKPFLVRIDKNIYTRRGEGEFAASKLTTNFGVRWSGVLRVAKDGPHVFTLQSDDDSRLIIDDKLVLEKIKGDVQKQFRSEPIALTKGDHPIRVEFTQGVGPAGITLRWQQPGAERATAITPEFLFHTKGADAAIAWDKKAWDEFKIDKSQVQPWERMDYGPFLAHTISAGDGNVALKGIAIKLGTEDDEATVLFDTELLRYAGGWTGGFLNYTGVAFDGSHGPSPTAKGDVVFTTKMEPGVAPDIASEATAKDPRPSSFGPMPRDYARYKGLYRNGDKVVLAYTVGERLIRELPEYFNFGGTPVFSRTIELAPGDREVTILLAEQDEGHPLNYSCGGGAVPQRIGNKLYVVLPQAAETRMYRLMVFPRPENNQIPPALDEGIAKLAADRPDVAALCKPGAGIWPKTVEVTGTLGNGDGPYVVDTIPPPFDNAYDAWIRFAGHDFFSDGRAALSTWSGDVWIVSGIDEKLEKLTWKRFASGLFQPLGLRIVDDQLYVLGRDGITRLIDGNNDGEADFYENFNNDVQVSSSFHEFALDLQTDPQGNFYFAKAGPVRPGGRGWETLTAHNGTVLKVSNDGSKLEVYATGVRAPNGMGAGPNGEISVADNEGTWTPQCRLSIVRPGGFLGVVDLAKTENPPTKYDPPICWLPHGEVDNSSGGQVWVPAGDQWGPFGGEMLHLSYGKCALFKVMKEPIGDGFYQGGVVQFPLGFDSGICRARFSPKDGQLYVSGLKGWQTTAAKDACFQRVRYTGKPVMLPTAMHVAKDGVSITFTQPLDKSSATNLDNYAVDQWNYLWTSEYGSPEVSVEDPSVKERDMVDVEEVTVSEDGKTIFLKIEDLKPVMQQKIEFKLKGADGKDVNYVVYHTINKVGAPSATATASAGK